MAKDDFGINQTGTLDATSRKILRDNEALTAKAQKRSAQLARENAALDKAQRAKPGNR